MLKKALLGLAMLAAVSGCATAQDMRMAPPGGGYKKVSTLVALPDFIPGLGTLYVKPGTLPVGPFLAYDHGGRLVSSIYMVPLKDLNAHKKLDDLASGPLPVDHVDFYYNAGHPGVEVPHYHVVLWYISEDEADKLK